MSTLLPLTGALSSRRARLVLVFAALFSLLALASAGFAVQITAITPSWQSPTGSSGAPSCLYTSNTPPSVEVRFGDTDLALPCPAPSAQSGLGFTAGATGTYTNGTPFVLGELTHFNQQVFASSLLTSATLNLDLTSSDPVAPSISTVVTVDETANNLATCPFGDTPPCSDQITIAPSVVSFTDGASNYQLEILGLIPGTAGSCVYDPANLRLALISEEDSNNSACLFGRVTQTNDAELEITKSTPATVLVPGQIVEYRIDYSCASTTASCRNVALTDFLPPQLEYLNSTGSIHTVGASGNHSASSNSVLFNFVDPLPAGSTGYVTIHARVTDNGTLANGQQITNTATSTISNGETNSSSTSTPVQTTSAWDVQKSGDAIAYVSTEPPITDMTYTVQICPNGSNVNLLNAQMVDTLPSGAEFVSVTGNGIYSAGSNTVTWSLGELKATDPCVARNVVVRFPNPPFIAGSQVVNTVNGSGTIVGGTPWTDTASLTRTLQNFVPNPSMTLDKGTARTDYVIGAQVDYALTPRNTGNTNLYNLVMTDTVPDAIRVTAIDVGSSSYPIVVEYALNGASTYTTWPGSPFNANTTLNVSALGLGPSDWVTSIRWRFNPGGNTPPNWSLSPAARIVGTITSPDRLGVPVTTGSQVSNHATIAWEYWPGGVGPCTNPGGVCGNTGSPNATVDIVPVPVPVFDKTSGGGVNQGNRFVIGQQVGYFDLSVNNNTGIAVDTFTLTDDIPVPFNVTAVNVGTYSSWNGTVGLRYQASNNPGVWVNWPGTPFAEGATANAPSLGTGVYISRVEFSFGSIPPGFRGAPRIYGTTLAIDRNGVAVTDGSTMTNTAQMDWMYQGVPSTRTDTTSDPIRLPTVTPVASKTVTSSGPYIPTSAVNYRLGIGAASSSPSNVMNNPIASDLLPTNVNYVSFTYDANGTAMPAPVLSQIANYNGTGRTLLRWTFTGSLNRGETVYINLNTTLAAGTQAGNLSNEVRVTVTDMPVNGGVPDSGDWDGYGGSGNSVSTGNTTIAVAPLVGLDSAKGVRGELDTNYSVFPSYGQTVPNGHVDYRLNVINRGNVPINNVRVIDILPFVGDTGVRDLRPRNSQWRPVLTTPVTPQSGVTIYYSTAQNPCRPEIVSTGPAGCTAANWSLIPPANISTVQSLRFDFAGTLAPGQSFTFQWRMRAPASAANGSVAWNSFAYASTNALTGVPLFPAEPNKVGIVFNATPTALIDIEKLTNGDDADLATGPLIPLNGTVNWSYVVTNIGETRLGNVTVTDDVEGAITCPKTTLEIGESMTCTLTDLTPVLGQYTNDATVIGTAIDGDDNPLDSDPSTTGIQLIQPTDEDPSHYYGYDPLQARLGDFTWIDLNANGIQESGEPPLGGVTVHLRDSTGTAVDDPNQPGTQDYITTTDFNGLYNFVNLAAGSYRVQFDIPTAYSLTIPNATSDASDSDAVPVSGQTYGQSDVVTLLAGQYNSTVDAGFIAHASIGDRIWPDSNGNGIQDASENSTALVSGIRVDLMDAAGTTVLATTFTDLAGNYLFTDLTPGSYHVRFPVPPSGYLWTARDAGSDDALDSDVNPANRMTVATALDANEVDPNWDAGLVPVASIGNYVWADNDFDGVQDTGEPGVAGITVRLLDGSGNQATRDDGTLITDVLTDANGFYSFTGLRPGVPYEVRFTRPSGAIFTAQNAIGSSDNNDSDAIETGASIGRTTTATLTPGQNDTSWDAGLIRLASLGDKVWQDTNNNGQQDSGEPGVTGAIVRLLDASGNPVMQDALGNAISTITTTSTGLYSFSNLDPRLSYIVEFQRPAAYNFATANSGADATDSDALPSGLLPLGIGRTGLITLTAGQNDTTIDAGLVPDSSLGDRAWYDTNNNGIQDAGETGVQNVTVRLLTSAGAQATDERGNPIPDQTTTAAGAYLFDHLRPGSYVVWFLPESLPSGYTFARTGAGTASTNSDPNRFTGRTSTTTLGVNVDDLSWDAGIVTEAALGNFVWEDRNANGQQDGGLEVGVAGVTVRLLDGSNNAIDNPNTNAIGDAYTTTTDASGLYSFVGLPPNLTYRVRFDRLGTYIWTPGNIGADATDSDGVVSTVNSTTITTNNITSLTPGFTDDTWDQGLLLPSGLGNLVWTDLNDDGRQTNEAARSGVTVRLLDSVGNAVDNPTSSGFQAYTATTNSTAAGNYSFTNLYPGQYIIEFVTPTGTMQSFYDVDGAAANGIDSDGQVPSGRTPVITLPYNTTDNSWDAGFVPLASIGNFVWRDNNNNGIQNSGEPGIQGVTVNLLNTNGSPVTLDAQGNTIPAVTTTTNASGNYTFTNLNPRLDYIVEFVRPADYKPSPANVLTGGGTAANNSDASLTTGRTTVIPVNPGQNYVDADAGFTPLARIGDYVWVDANGNGQQDAGETGLNGVTVTLRDGSGNGVTTDGLGNPIVPVQTSNNPTGGAPGYYQFSNLNAGTYQVQVTLPSGYIFTRQNTGADASDSDVDRFTGRTGTYTFSWGTSPVLSDQTVDAGVVQPASLGDYVWYDTNDNGQQNSGEPGVNGMVVRLLDSSGNAVDNPNTPAVNDAYVVTTATNVGNPGWYLFQNLIPGDYRVQFDLAASTLPEPSSNYVFARQNQGGDATDSDPDRATGRTDIINLSAGENDLTNDAGILLRSIRLGNRVWIDINNNGVQDGGEAGLSGVTVTLLNSSGGTDIDPITPGTQTLSTTTAFNATYGNGWYEFSNLVPGPYIVQVTLPAGYQFSPQDAVSAPDADTDSDVSQTTGQTTIINVGEKGNDPTWDAGMVPLASIGDRVWIDANDNGVQDGGELGYSGATVRLLDSNGNRVDNPNLGGTQDYILATNSSGNYQFVNLPPDRQYRVEFVRPIGYLFSAQDVTISGATDNTDSDANPTDGRSIATLLSPGEDDLSWDAGLVPLASIGDFVWRDNNGNGVQDNGEPGLSGVTVTLLNAATGNPVTTDGNGNAINPIVTGVSGAYSFTNLDPRLDYVVQFSLPGGYIRSSQDVATSGGTDANDSDADVSTGRTATIALNPGDAITTVDAGYSPLSSLGDFIWNDVNGDGVQNNGETGIANAIVTLLDGSNNPVTTDALGNVINPVVTSSSGAYSFTNLPDGTYRVRVTPPTGYVLTRQDAAAATDATDSDVDRFTGITANITLGWGQQNLTIDAGVFQPARLGDYVWEDQNYNGQQDSGEPAVTGVSVRLLDTSGNRVDNPNVAGIQDYIVSTDGSGNYGFTGLFPGSYVVEFVAPSGAEFTQPNTSADVSDSDANVSTGRTGTYTLAANGSDQTADAGIFYRASIGDRVWIDLNNNGVQDGGESGYQGATVTLYTGAGVQVGTPQTTSSSGNYLFDNLLPGDYYVVVTLPSGYQFSPTGAGTAATDSDSDPTTGQMPTTTLISNEDDLSWDAGLVPLASIGDKVWIDLNDNGVQDGGESGLSGVTVRLLDASGNRVDNPNIAGNQDYILTTDTNGNYQFVNLTPDVQYRVEFVRPSGYLFSTQDAGSPNNDATDSDANPADGRTIATLLSPGENDLTWDAGFVPLASLGNFVWNDANHNGIQDNGESGLAGVTVTLRDSNGVQVTTDGNGNAISPIVTNSSGAYSFTNLSPRIDYIVEFSRPDGWKRSPTGQGTSATDSNPAQSGPNAGRTAVIDLAPGEANDTIDAGYSQLATLGDFIWNDANGDGIQNNGETGIAGATVTLLDGSNNPVTTDGLGNAISAITTDSSGAYLFPNLNAGTYRIQVTPPTGYVLTLQDQGVDTADSDVDRFTGRSADYVLGWGQTDLTADAGVFQPARLGNYVWEDLNYNGQQNEPASSGVNGVTVRLLDSNGVRVDDPNTAGTQDYIVTTANDGGGNPGYYEFTGLFPGSYIVEFVAPSGAEFTQPNTGADVSDSDANVSTGRTGTYTLAANGSDQTADAGIFYRTSIGDRVWIDLNNNGVQDGGESGYQGATVTLYTGAGVQVGTPQTTSSSGNYLFDNLLPGDYYVVVTLPSGYQFSPTGAGTSTTDSDSDPITGRMPTTTLISNEDDLSWDAGLVPLASIGDKVWNDVGGDGAQDSGEAGVGGVTVHLYRDGGTIPYRTTTTSSTVGSEGDYLFDDVPPGDYFLEFVAPSGMMFTRQDATTDTTDSDADRVSGRTITTTLSPGEDDWTWDAGILQPAAIGDYIWEDVNDNGQQDESASSGQNGITVRLLDSNGNAVDNPNTPAVDTYEVTTADNGGNPGYYAFTGLFPADYVVEFVLPSSNWVFARPNQGMDTSDSDASRTNGRTSAINLIAGETDNTVDAGLLQLASLGDRIWIDLDNNGVQDGGEPGYQGATVTLYDGTGTQVGSPQTTDANGDYRFSDLVPGDYYVVVTLPSGYQFSPTGAGTNSTDSDSDFTTGRMPTTTLISGEDDDTWDAGLVPLASIGDRVWRDDNGNGVQDAGEPGLGGVTVHLHRNGDTAPYRMTTTSSASGSEGIYRFENVPPGDYFIEFVRPAGYISSPQDSSLGTEATDSNADTTTGRTFPTNLSPGEDDRTWDAGFVPLGSIGDRVWMDYSKDGVQDPGEESLIGIGMILTLPDGSTLSTMTNSSGLYLFERLAPGVYTVTVDTSTLPAGVYQTYDLDGFLNDATTYTLGANENVRTLDFGYAPVWNAPTPPPDDQPTPTPTPVILGTPATSAVSNVDGVTVIPAENALVCSTGCPNFRLYHTDETGDWEIFRLDSADPQARTTSRVNLSLGTGQGVNDMAPSLSPNSQWIVFTSNRDTQPGQPENWEIYVAPTSGGNPDAVQRVTVNHFANDTDPVWGPNNWVVFESNRNGNWDLYAVDMSTGIEVRLTDDPTDDINAFWSPDGSKLVFQSQRDGQWQIYELTLATGDVRRLSDGSAIDVDPVYSPDGTRIAFRTYSAGNANSVISLMNGDGTGRTAISSADGNATNQVWSPDGALIAYQSDLDGDLDIYVFELSSQGTRQITDNTIPDYAPAWRCSNDIVLFTSDIAGDPNIYEENARPMTDPAVLVEIASDQLTFETFDDIYPQMSPSEENASREGQTPDGVFGQQTEFLRPVVERTTPDLSIDGITREVWNPLDGCQPAP